MCREDLDEPVRPHEGERTQLWVGDARRHKSDVGAHGPGHAHELERVSGEVGGERFKACDLRLKLDE